MLNFNKKCFTKFLFILRTNKRWIFQPPTKWLQTYSWLKKINSETKMPPSVFSNGIFFLIFFRTVFQQLGIHATRINRSLVYFLSNLLSWSTLIMYYVARWILIVDNSIPTSYKEISVNYGDNSFAKKIIKSSAAKDFFSYEIAL